MIQIFLVYIKYIYLSIFISLSNVEVNGAGDGDGDGDGDGGVHINDIYIGTRGNGFAARRLTAIVAAGGYAVSPFEPV